MLQCKHPLWHSNELELFHIIIYWPANKKRHTFTKKLPNLNILMYLQNNIGPAHLLSLLIFNFLIEAKDFYLGLGYELIFLCFLGDDNTPSIMIVKGRWYNIFNFVNVWEHDSVFFAAIRRWLSLASMSRAILSLTWPSDGVMIRLSQESKIKGEFIF